MVEGQTHTCCWVNCKEEDFQAAEANLRGESGGGQQLPLGSKNGISFESEEGDGDILEAGNQEERKKGKANVESESEDCLVVVVGEIAGVTSDHQGVPSTEHNELEFFNIDETCTVSSPPGEVIKADTDKGAMYRGLEIESEDDDEALVVKINIEVISSTDDTQTTVTNGQPVSLDVVEEEQDGDGDKEGDGGEEGNADGDGDGDGDGCFTDIVTPSLSLLLFSIFMPCLDIYFDSMLLETLFPRHSGCFLVIVCALTVNFAFTCLAWWRLEPESQKTWSWIFLLLQIWPQLKAGQVK